MVTRESNGATEARSESRGVERAESAITQSPTSPSPFLKELDSITGPNSAAGSGARAMEKLDRDGFTGRAEALEAYKIMSETRSWLSYQTGLSSISRQDVEQYGQRTNLSRGEKALVDRLQRDFGKISSDGQNITGSDVKNYLAREQQHTDMRNLYARDGQTGRSLYDSVKDGNGGVSGDKLTAGLNDPTLTRQDRASLEALDKIRNYGNGDISSGALQRANDAAGLTPQERQNRDNRKRSEPLSAEAQAGQTALSDLTAKPNGGRSMMERISDGNGGLSMRKIDALAANPERNNLTQRNVDTLKYLQDHAPLVGDYKPADLQKLAADSGQSWDRLSARPERTRLDDASRSRQEEFAHLFEKRNGRESLYDRVKSADGGISTDRINAELKNPALGARDRHSLEYVKSLARDGWTDKKDISRSELVDKAHQHNIADRDLKRAGIDPTTEPTITRPVPRPNFGGTGGELPESVHSALKVRAGEGYYHTAERLIAEAHKGQRYDPTQAELSSVAKQLSAANGNRRELKQNEELVIDQNVRSNPALAGLFR
ncbi:MAG: hypothetical protein JST89_23470 [Cyanobacteria bacterium SZAS-4]|nr:hypothetical protein [Cyanobacteria bacterium SZAS-4]